MNCQPVLSVVLPIHNDCHCLVRQVQHLLDVLPDLATHFEVVILDNGSSDQSDEVAHDLARWYPQLRVQRHAQRYRCREQLLHRAFAASLGDYILVCEEGMPIRATQLRQLWEYRQGQRSPGQLAASSPPAAPSRADHAGPSAASRSSTRMRRSESDSLVQRLSNWAVGLPEPSVAPPATGLQLFRRDAATHAPSRRAASVAGAEAPRKRERPLRPFFPLNGGAAAMPVVSR